MKLSNQEGRALLAKQGKKKSREGNVPTEYNGVTYASKKEANRARQLDWKVAAELIKGWKCQVPFKIEIAGIHITTYIADFVVDHGSRIEVEDCKGRKSGGPYQMFIIKKRLMKIVHGIDIIEI